MEKEIVCDFGCLYKAMKKCKKGVMWKDSVARYCNNGLASILKLCSSLEDGSYKLDKYYRFTVHEPKTREIVSNKFKDRVFQRSLCDNYLYDEITRGFVYDNAACQNGKGTDFAMDRLTCHMQRFFRRYGLDGWVLKIDVKDYFGSTPHKTARAAAAECVREPWALEHMYKIIESYATPEKPDSGIGLGSQVNQLLQLLILDNVDHLIKENLRIKAYVRYADDFVLICRGKERLKQAKGKITKRLAVLGLRPNADKTQIFPLKQGINFLGFKFRLTETGKVIRIVSKENVKKRKRKLRKYRDLVKKGEMTRRKADECYNDWKAHAEKGNSFKLLKRMDEYYAKLWKE